MRGVVGTARALPETTDDHVLGLDVAMHEPSLVRRHQAARSLVKDREDFLGRARLSQPRPEALPLDKLEGHPPALDAGLRPLGRRELAEVVNGDDVGMRQPR